jgi:hypothetical protein
MVYVLRSLFDWCHFMSFLCLDLPHHRSVCACDIFFSPIFRMLMAVPYTAHYVCVTFNIWLTWKFPSSFTHNFTFGLVYILTNVYYFYCVSRYGFMNFRRAQIALETDWPINPHTHVFTGLFPLVHNSGTESEQFVTLNGCTWYSIKSESLPSNQKSYQHFVTSFLCPFVGSTCFLYRLLLHGVKKMI